MSPSFRRRSRSLPPSGAAARLVRQAALLALAALTACELRPAREAAGIAASDGVVISAGPYAGYGNMVKLRHADGTVTLYGHLSSWSVEVGQRVWAGDQIANMGNTGNSTGPHLHFEVHLNGTDRVDPVGWLAKRGLSPSN